MADELKGMRGILACPTYGPVDPVLQRKLRGAMMFAANRGFTWVGDASPDRLDFATARNSVAQTAYEDQDGADGVMWVDSDIDVPVQAIAQLLTSARGYDIVSGVYHKREAPHEPVLYHYSPNLKRFLAVEQYPADTFLKIGGCGFGFVWTSTKAIRQIAGAKGFSSTRGWFPDDRHKGGFGEDLSFCFAAQQLGIELWCDTAVQVGHVGGSVAFWREDYLREWQRVRETGGYLPEDRSWGLRQKSES